MPAVVYTDGEEKYYIHGQLHRGGDQPALINDGSMRWYQYGRLHRGNRRHWIKEKPALVSTYSNVKEYYCNGKLMERTGTKRGT
jgi:hypothetical protein